MRSAHSIYPARNQDENNIFFTTSTGCCRIKVLLKVKTPGTGALLVGLSKSFKIYIAASCTFCCNSTTLSLKVLSVSIRSLTV